MSTKFDKLINKKISESEVSPSAGLWNKIEAELDKKDNKKLILIPFWQHGLFKKVLAASVIFLLGGITANYMFNENTKENEIQFSEKKSTIENTIVSAENTTNEEKKIIDNIENDELKTAKNNKADKLNTNNSFAKNSNSLNNSVNTNILNSTKTSSINNVNKTTKPFTNINSNNNNFQANNNSINQTIKNGSNNNKLSASNYNWIYDEQTGAYQVVLKKENELLSNSFLINNSVNQNKETPLMANENKLLENKTEGQTSMMSLIEEEKEEKIETLELNQEEDSYKQFKAKAKKLNYKGLWLGPNVGYESLFAAGEHYAGGNFGIDVGYDFGRSFGFQTGVKYAIHSKMISVNDADGNLVDYKSELNSVHVPFLMRYKFTKLTQKYNKPLSLNLLTGIDYSFMDRKGLHQLGFVAGAEYDIFTQADLMFTIGLRGGVYNNLNKDKVVIPETLTPYNYTLSAYIAVRFIDWAKRR